MAWSIKLFWIQHAASTSFTSLGRSANPAYLSDNPIIVEVSALAFSAGRCKTCFRLRNFIAAANVKTSAPNCVLICCPISWSLATKTPAFLELLLESITGANCLVVMAKSIYSSAQVIFAYTSCTLCCHVNCLYQSTMPVKNATGNRVPSWSNCSRLRLLVWYGRPLAETLKNCKSNFSRRLWVTRLVLKTSIAVVYKNSAYDWILWRWSSSFWTIRTYIG